MATPMFKVYSADGEYEAATKHADAALAIVAGIGSDGWTIRWGHARKDTVWAEGKEELPAGESYDRAAEIVYAHVEDIRRRWRIQGDAD